MNRGSATCGVSLALYVFGLVKGILAQLRSRSPAKADDVAADADAELA